MLDLDLIEDKWDANWWRRYSILKNMVLEDLFFLNLNLKRYFSMPLHLGTG
jgi:hypothetical protein